MNKPTGITSTPLAPGESIVRTAGENNCGGRCIIHAHVVDGRVVRITSDPDKNPATSLRACPKGLSYHQTFLGEDRLRYPLLRTGPRGSGRFERISWERALDLLASETRRIKAAYGPASRFVLYATGENGLVNGKSLIQRLLALDGGYLGYYNSYSTACSTYTTPYTYGTALSGNSPDSLLDSKVILLLGHNPTDTRFGKTAAYLKLARDAGAQIIVVDPRQSATAVAVADEWVGIRPTTDSALLDAMAFVIITENRYDRHFIDTHCLGFDAAHMPPGAEGEESYFDYILGERDGVPKTPAWAAPITGIPPEQITRLARLYADSKPAALIHGYGSQRHANGEQTTRSATALACLTGNVGISGGWAAGVGDVKRHTKPVFPVPENPCKAAIPVFLWTDAIFRGEEMTAATDGVTGVERLPGNIKMIYNIAGNTLINQHSQVNRTMEILTDESLCEFVVTCDLFLTPSARWSDLVLPGTSFFERNNIATSWDTVDDFLLFQNQAIDPLHECRSDYDWIRDLADRLELGDAFAAGHETAEEWLESIYTELRRTEPELPDYHVLRTEGVYKFKQREPVVAFREQIENPGSYPFPTPSGKIEIYSPRLRELGEPVLIPPVPKYVPAFEGPQDPLIKKYPLQLIGWHTKRRCHSIHDNNPRLEEMEPHRMWMHPRDAAARGLRDWDLAEVWNDRGRVRIPVQVTDRIMAGVVAIPQGAWYTPDADGVDIRGCINVLTTARPTPLARGNPQHSNLVEVKRHSLYGQP